MHSKLIHALFQALLSFLVSLSAAIYSFLNTYGNVVAISVSICAGVYSIYATHETLKHLKTNKNKKK